MKTHKKLFNGEEISFLNKIDLHTLILFGLISVICIFFDFYYQNSNLVVPFIGTTLITSIITILSIPQLKKIKIKQIIREEGPKKHFLKQGTPTMGGIFFIPIGIIISNLLYFNKGEYKIIL
mgnify:CR=1 FL=1